MWFTGVHIRNFKAIRDMELSDVENALILVGKNNTGKTTVLDAIRAATGSYRVQPEDFNERRQNIEIGFTMAVTDEDLEDFYRRRAVSQYRRYEAWKRDFYEKLPSLREGRLRFTYSVNWEGKARFSDGYRKDNRHIPELLPKVYSIDTQRDIRQFQDDLLLFLPPATGKGGAGEENVLLKEMRSNSCLFEASKKCNHCFDCVPLIGRKTAGGLNTAEAARLLEYKLYQTNFEALTEKVNENFHKNGGVGEIRYTLDCDMERVFQVSTRLHGRREQRERAIGRMSKGMKSIYLLSLLETYVGDETRMPSVILIEEPEIHLHPQLQRTAGEILYRLSKKNQVIFTTHSPNMLFNFNRRQIRQIVLDPEYYAVVRSGGDIGSILDDLGYAANDFLNVGFVFIVEGKQDKSRLPLLLERYYSEVYDGEGNLSAASIITTNSCTNIKTYANLKYMNRVYLRDQFLMIRDGDGEDPEVLAGQLCKYYEDRNREDVDRLPKVSRRNVLILKYYSFENYFLNPKIMVRLGIVGAEEEFYEVLYERWKEYLHRLRSGRHLIEVIGRDLESPEDVRAHMEQIRVYVRGHNLFDIFYGRFKDRETELLKGYIELAPREEFQDILDAIDRFAYFDSKKRAAVAPDWT